MGKRNMAASLVAPAVAPARRGRDEVGEALALLRREGFVDDARGLRELVAQVVQARERLVEDGRERLLVERLGAHGVGDLSADVRQITPRTSRRLAQVVEGAE